MAASMPPDPRQRPDPEIDRSWKTIDIVLVAVVAVLAGALLALWGQRSDGQVAELGPSSQTAQVSAGRDESPESSAAATVAELATTADQEVSRRFPDLMGLDIETARSTLAMSAASDPIAILVSHEAHADAAPGTVVRQAPMPGVEFGPDTHVNLWVAPPASAAAPTSAPEQEPEVHPQVQAQAMEIVGAIANEHSHEWRWIAPAMEHARLRFFEDLPDGCADAIGCYRHSTGEVWLSLDALREQSGLFSRRPSSRYIVLHELAHAYTRATPEGQSLEHKFSRHYAGCRLDRFDADSDRLAVELLADTMTLAAIWSMKDPLSTEFVLPFVNAGGRGGSVYFTGDGFDGCLADSEQPDPSLMTDVYTTLFDCASGHALDVFEANERRAERRFLVGTPSADEEAVLRACYGIECDDRGNCSDWSDNGARQTAARDAIRDR